MYEPDRLAYFMRELDGLHAAYKNNRAAFIFHGHNPHTGEAGVDSDMHLEDFIQRMLYGETAPKLIWSSKEHLQIDITNVKFPNMPIHWSAQYVMNATPHQIHLFHQAYERAFDTHPEGL